MKKNNEKGFLLSETLIVSTFVLTLIMLLFIQFKGVIVNNKKQYIYNNVENIYSLGSFSEFLIKNQSSANYIKNYSIPTNGYYQIYTSGSGCVSAFLKSGTQSFCNTLASSMGLEYVFLTDSNINTVKSKVLNVSNVNQDMKDFIEKINADKVYGKKRLFAKFTNGNFATVAMNI